MTRERWLSMPLAYTVLTRLQNARGVLDYLTRDVAIPLLPAVAILGADGLRGILLWVGFAVLYEIGYVINDRATTAAERGGHRLGEAHLPLVWILVTRLLTWGGVVIAASVMGGSQFGLLYGVISLAVVTLLIVHTYLSSHTTSLRFLSFALLALTKYAPFLVPLIGWDRAVSYLGAIYLMYGFPRTAYYVIRKLPSERTEEEIRTFQLISHGLGLVPAMLIISPELIATIEQGWNAPALLWVLYSLTWAAALLARTVRRSF